MLLTNKMIPNPTEHNRVFDLVISIHIATAAVIARVLHEGAALAVDVDDAGREAALQQRGRRIAHLTSNLDVWE